MRDLIPKNTDEEMERYMEAEMIRQARIPLENNAALIYEADPITKRENALFPLSSGGYVKIGERARTPAQAAETDLLAAAQTIQNSEGVPISEIIGGANGPTLEDYEAAGFTEAQVREYQAQVQAEALSQPGVMLPNVLTEEQMQFGEQVGADFLRPGETSLRDRVRDNVFRTLELYNESEMRRLVNQVMEEQQVDEETAMRIIRTSGADADIGVDANGMRFWSDYLTDFIDVTVPGVGGAMSVDEGVRIARQGAETGNVVDMAVGAALGTMGIVELVPLVGSLTEPARRALRENLSPEARNIIADMIGTTRALSRGDREMLSEIFQPAGTPRPLGADATRTDDAVMQETQDFLDQVSAPETLYDRTLALSQRLSGIREGAAQNITLAPPSADPMVGQLAPQYRVRVEGFEPQGSGRQSFIPRKLTPGNAARTNERLTEVAQEFTDPLASAENYAAMMARVRNAVEVPAPPSWMIGAANDMEQWSRWFSGLTPDQIRAADDGLSVQNDFRNAYQSGAGPELTGQLMLWSILSRMLSAFPHESGFLELAENATPFIRRAAAGEWTDADTQAWLEMVPRSIPEGTPGRSATSNANAFGETFLRKMAAVDENGTSALLRLHQMIADPNMSSAEIRRQYYSLAEDTGIANKILSFALLVAGRNDVVVLDRIQINRMWAGGDKVYDDIMGQFEGAQGLVQYEALERSLASRIEDLYRATGREGEGSVGRYHWESWVLSSGQVVSHPTLEAVVRAGTPDIPRNMPATSGVPVMEGRFHRWNYGVRYERLPDGGNRYVYETSTGEPYQFTKDELDAMFRQVQQRRSGVLPPDFPGVSSFEGGNIPWFEYEGVNRERLDQIIRESGRPLAAE